MKGKIFTSVLVWAAILLLLSGSLTQAQEPATGKINAPAAVEEVSDGIPIQGRLTDSAGNPLSSGDYNIAARLYEQDTGGEAICSHSELVSVVDGLFNTYIDGCGGVLRGQQVWLGVEVGSDGEMTPRQMIRPAPYALTLRPGAVISDTRTNAILTVRNGEDGIGLAAHSDTGYALWAQNWSADHAAIYGWNYGGVAISGLSLSTIGVTGVGVVGVEGTGLGSNSVALKASGTGVIQSSANSYLWVSGNGLRPFHQNDSTIIDMDTHGGALVYRGAAGGNKNVMLPIAITAPLYGQDVTVSALDIYWQGQTEFDAISAVILRRQIGACAGSECYEDLVYDVGGIGYTCEDGVVPQGCIVHYAPEANNILTKDSGVLYLTIELAFSGDSTWINIGGVRLTLEHD